MKTPPLTLETALRQPGAHDGRLRAAWLDAAGITVSVVCAVHCAASAVFLAALAILGIADTLPEWLEWAFLGASLLIGAIALRTGLRVHHRRGPLRVFGFGIGVLLLARVLGLPETAEPLVVVVGATALVAAHALNWRHGRECGQCASGDTAASAQ